MQTFSLPTRPITHRTPFLANPGLGKGVNELTKPARFKIGVVSVREGRTPKHSVTFWELRYTDPESGWEVKRRVQGLSRVEVTAIAEHLTREAYAGRGYLAGRPKAPTIQEGIAEALRLSRMHDQSRRDLARRALLFVRWLEDKYPTVKTWDQVRPGMVQAYVLDCERQGLAWDSVRLRLVPVKSAWRRMREAFPELVHPLGKISMAPQPRRKIECLEPAELVDLLDWMKAKVPDLWGMANLQALCGLRMLEAASLRVQDVDSKAGIIEITETPRHRPKTRDSYRVIPVCGAALVTIRAVMEAQTVIPVTGEIFPIRAQGSVSKRWTKWLRHAALELNRPRYAEIQARKLRAAFATMAGRLELPDRIVKAYLGHVPGDMLGGHYRVIGLDELRVVSERMNDWRSLACVAEGRKHFGNIASEGITDC